MTTTDHDDRLGRYFDARASEIPPPTLDAELVRAKGRRRRRRRTAARAGAGLSAVALLAGAVVIRGADESPTRTRTGVTEQATPAAQVDSPFDWTMVTPRQGLGWTLGTATLPGHGMYSLSTSAPERPDDPYVGRVVPTLYRSDGGQDWSRVELGDLSPAAIAADDEAIYAVGTAPMGGAIGVSLARSVDGSSWDRTALPIDVAALGRGLPGGLSASASAVARAGGRTVVAVSLTPNLPPEVLRAHGLRDGDGYELDEEGVVILDWPCDQDPGQPDDQEPGGATAPGADEPPTTVAPGVTEGSDTYPTAVAGSGDAGGTCDQPARRLVPWSEFGVSPEVGARAAGQMLLFAAEDGQPFRQVHVASRAWADTLIGTDDGFWIAVGARTSDDEWRTRILHSADGATWSPSGELGTDMVLSGGMVDGHPTLAVLEYPDTGRPEPAPSRLVLARLTEQGIERTDVSAALPRGVHTSAVSGAAFGPLGVAIAVDADEGERHLVVTSTDGRTVSVVEPPAAPPGKVQILNGVQVTEDAVNVRLNLYDEGEGDAGRQGPPQQRVYVGTPR